MAAFLFSLSVTQLKIMNRTLPYVMALAAFACVACAENAPAVTLTPKQEAAVQKNVEASLHIHRIVLTLRDAAGVEAAMPELRRWAVRRNMQSRHLKGAFQSRTDMRAALAKYGWTEEHEMESKYQLERLAANHFYGSVALAAYYGLPAEYAKPLDRADAAKAISEREELLALLRAVHDAATADAAAPRVAELLASCVATGLTPQHIMQYDPMADAEVRSLHAEYVSLLSVDFYGSTALRDALNNTTP